MQDFSVVYLKHPSTWDTADEQFFGEEGKSLRFAVDGILGEEVV